MSYFSDWNRQELRRQNHIVMYSSHYRIFYLSLRLTDGLALSMAYRISYLETSSTSSCSG